LSRDLTFSLSNEAINSQCNSVKNLTVAEVAGPLLHIKRDPSNLFIRTDIGLRPVLAMSGSEGPQSWNLLVPKASKTISLVTNTKPRGLSRNLEKDLPRKDLGQ
jgi:hypothetical protein